MVKFITGEHSHLVIGKLNASLKGKVVARASALDNAKYKAYTPWLSSRPILDTAVPHELSTAVFSKGELAIETAYLETAKHFLNGQGITIFKGMKYPASYWNIMSDIKRNREDAIESFKEAKHEIKRSSLVHKMYETVVDIIIPLQKERPSGFDTNYILGAVFRVFPPDCTAKGVAFELAHGTGHQVGLLLSSIDILIASGRNKTIYYAPRDDHRYAIDAFYSALALGYMTLLFKEIPDAADFQKKDPYLNTFKKELPSALKDGVDCIRKQASLTAIGNAVLNELEEVSAA